MEIIIFVIVILNCDLGVISQKWDIEEWVVLLFKNTAVSVN
jgi:hypothetical protein